LTINGASSALAYLPAADLLSGATLGFTLGSSADTSWAAAPADAPPSYGGTPGTGVTEPVGAITGDRDRQVRRRFRRGHVERHAIQIYTCNGTDAQDWTVAPDNTLQVLTDCMDVTGGATTAGTDIDLNTCNGTAAQQWERNSSGELVNPASGLCLTDTSGGATVKTQLTLETCADTTGQVWTLPST
jgi:hypothetical protein